MPIWEVTKDHQDRRVIKLFGRKLLRFKPTKRFLIRKLQNEINLLKASLDITHMPPAMGWMRDIQLANLAIMKEVVRVCEEHNFKYWMSEGTLLGAVRHGGFIPWDDDIDLGMMREDYERFAEVFNLTGNPELHAEHIGEGCGRLIQVCHKTIPSIFIDIFAFDYYYGSLEGWDARCEFTQKIKKRQIQAKVAEDAAAFFKKWRNCELCGERSADFKGKPLVYKGIDYYSWSDRCLFYDYDDIFPLQKIVFEGEEFSAPRRPFVPLSCVYGDYMSFPRRRYAGNHVDVRTLPLSEIMAIRAWRENMEG